MGELAITKHRELQDVHRWWTKSNKQLPFNRVLKRNNSPQSLISGIVNNIMYGDQYDFSEVQLVHLQNIISNCTQLINVIEEEYNIQIQKSADHDSVMFMQEYFE